MLIHAASTTYILRKMYEYDCEYTGIKVQLKLSLIIRIKFNCTKGQNGGRVDWSLGIQRCDRGFKSQWQWVRSAIITEAVFRSFLITPRWFLRGTPVSSTNKKAAKIKFKIDNIMRGPTICPPFIIT